MGLAEGRALALSLGGLALGYDYQETSGTVITDFSTAGVNGTLGTRGALGGPAIIDGAARSLQSNGAAGAGNALTRPVTNGDPLQALNAFSLLTVIQPEAMVSNRGIIERPNHWVFRQWSTGVIQANIRLNGTFQGLLSTYAQAPINVPTLLEFFWEEPFYGFRMNGCQDIVPSTPVTGQLTQNATDTIVWGVSGGATLQGKRQFDVMFTRKISLGEHRELAATLGTQVDRQGGAFFDFPQDADEFIAATPLGGYCHVSGGKIREAGERVVDNTSTRRRWWHRTMYEGGLNRATEIPPPLDENSGPDEWGARVLAHGLERLLLYSSRPNSTRPTYHNGTKWVGFANGDSGNLAGGGAMAAIMARYIYGGGRGTRGAIHPDPLIRLALLDLDFLEGYAGPDFYAPDTEFTVGQYMTILHSLDGLIPQADWEARAETALAMTNAYYFTNGNKWWYTNGNRECGEHHVLIHAAILDPGTWMTEVDFQFDRILSPPGNAGGTPGGGIPFGIRYGVVPTQPDGSDGQAWLGESHGAAKPGNPPERAWWNWGSVGPAGENDATRETVDVQGLSKEYCSLATQFMLSAWVAAKNNPHVTFSAAQLLRMERLSNLIRNKLQTFMIDEVSWIIDASYGSRHTTNFTLGPQYDLALAWQGGRDDIDLSRKHLQWFAAENVRRGENFRGAVTNGFLRDGPYSVGLVLQSLPDYPWS